MNLLYQCAFNGQIHFGNNNYCFLDENAGVNLYMMAPTSVSITHGVIGLEEITKISRKDTFEII